MYTIDSFSRRIMQVVLFLLCVFFILMCKNADALEEELVPWEEQLLSAYEKSHGEIGFGWTQETWVSFGEALRNGRETHGIADPYLNLIAGQLYSEPGGDVITREDAIRAALLPAAAAGAIDFTLPYDAHALLIRLWKEPLAPMNWVVSFCQDNAVVSGMVDAETGEKYLFSPVSQEMQKILPFIIPASFEKTYPHIWRTDAAPTYYWDALDDIVFTCADVERMIDAWFDNLSAIQMKWPVAYQAISWLWRESDASYAPNTFLLGIPGPEDIDQETATLIAYEALLRDAQGLLSADTLEALTPYATFYYDLNGPGIHTWTISFTSPSDDGTYLITLASYSINAKQENIIDFYVASTNVHG